ncbi:hypothetical protein IU483_35300 [Streptomyces gardneri]|nr:hypothetical protein [Streptomyces gardneri]
MIGPKDVRTRDLPDPDGSRFGVPTFYWGTAPEGLATRRQLREMGLRPNGQDIAAQTVRPRRSGREPLAAYLYRVQDAAPKRTASPAQLAAVARATRARQERAMQRHGVEVPELERPELTDGPVWDGWDGFDR